MRIRVLFLALLLIFGAEGGGFFAAKAQDAQQQHPVLLTIDQDRLFTKSLYGERITREIKEDATRLEGEFKRIEADLTAEEKALTEKRKTMSAEQFRPLADAFDKKVQEIRKAQDARARDLDRRLNEERANFYQQVEPILRDLLAEMGASAIIDNRVVLLAAEQMDITDEALRRIDAILGDGADQENTAPQEPQQ
ncbi:MAG TPA: OmpH family outer membrane protein [Rhodobacteraceae bacterium]|nr:OmpH family outer membrane protein [Paracoccaceae bacterium]